MSHRPSDDAPQFYTPGHFYSPIPNAEEVRRAITANQRPDELTGVDLREAAQLELLERLKVHYPEVPFPEQPSADFRYAFENPSYSWCDGIILFCLLRELRPRRIIEVGSGYSSGLMLDVNERYFGSEIDCTFIEPFPNVLLSLLRPHEARRVSIIPSKLQDVDASIFECLGPGDILFIDSSHVVKAGSDVRALFFDVLPKLQPGVVIHFHDIFDRFEYPAEWLEKGIVWNEQYMLRAFLQFNSAFQIKLYTPHMIATHGDWFTRWMPRCLRNSGGHIWIERTGNTAKNAATPSSARRISPPPLRFRCNICGEDSSTTLADLEREKPTCGSCGSTPRVRAIIRALSTELFRGESAALPDFPSWKEMRGLGMTDWIGYAEGLAEKFTYTNTFLHQEPRLDIGADEMPPDWMGAHDFIISSEVLEHVLPPVSKAFDNILRLLKPGGVLILTVPYTLMPDSTEHFPELHDFSVVQEDGTSVLRNTTEDGEVQEFRNLVFHGGPGSTLEMRVFSENALLRLLREAGFEAIKVHREPDIVHGVWWPEPWSLPISARKPCL